MTPSAAVLLLLVLAAPPQDTSPRHADCHEWQECRQLAADAAARKDFEAFHDLAWRAVQRGPKNDPALMYLLARAQSLSGRPGDALVMLQRLAQMGMSNDAVTSDDFERVRLLPAGQEFFGIKADAAGAVDATRAVEATDRAKLEAAGAGTTRAGTGVEATSGGGVAETLRFTTPPFSPAGLAYDGVSRRFIVGDRHARKLAVVDEFSQHVATLASAVATGFGDIAALEIDPHEGNLWVVTVDGPKTVLHKLQLVSGRSLASYTAAASFGSTQFTDVAATHESAVLVLDRGGHRLFRLRPKAPSLELAATLPDGRPSSVAPAGTIVYVADDGGVTRVDLSSRVTTPLKAAAGVDLRGITRLRWYRGSLIAIQQSTGAGYRAIRIALDRGGRTATAVDVLDASLRTMDPTAATVAGNVLYYLVSGDSIEMIVKRIGLR